MTSLIALFTLLWALRSDVAALGLTRLTEIALGSLLVATTIQIVLVGWYNLRVMTARSRERRIVEDVRAGGSDDVRGARSGDRAHFFPSEVLQLLQFRAGERLVSR